MRSVLLMVAVVLSASCDLAGSAGYKQELALFATPPSQKPLGMIKSVPSFLNRLGTCFSQVYGLLIP